MRSCRSDLVLVRSTTAPRVSIGAPRSRAVKASECEGNLALTRRSARLRFLAAVSHAAPGVMEDLAGAPLKAARSAWNEQTVEVPGWLELGASSGNPIREALLGWAHRWHLSDTWCLQAAVLTLGTWITDEASCEQRSWYLQPTGSESDGFGAEDLSFRIPGSPKETRPSLPPGTFHFDPRLETRAEAMVRARAIANALEAFIDRTLERAEEAGLQSSRTTARDEHFEWLVAYQILGRTWANIRDQHGERIEYYAIYQAVHRLAGYLELSLRPADAWD